MKLPNPARGALKVCMLGTEKDVERALRRAPTRIADGPPPPHAEAMRAAGQGSPEMTTSHCSL